MSAELPAQSHRTRSGRLWHLSLRLLGGVLLCALVLLALLISAGRYWIPSVGQYRADLERVLSDLTGAEVQIGGLSGLWQGVDPRLQLDNLRLAHGDQQLRVGQLRARVDVLASLWRQQLVVREFVIADAEVLVIQADDGQLSLAGIDYRRLQSDSRDTDVAAHLAVLMRNLQDPEVRLEYSRLGLAVAGEAVRWVDLPDVRVALRGRWIEASGTAMQVGAEQGAALRFRMRGQHLLTGRFSGELYLAADSGQVLDGVLQPYRLGGLGLFAVDARAEAWLHIHEGRWGRLVVALEAPRLHWATPDLTLAPLEDVHVLTDIQREAEGYRWRAQWSADWAGQSIGPLQAQGVHRPDAWEIALDRLPLMPVATALLATDLLPDRANAALKGYDPAGELRALWITSSAQAPFRLEAALYGVNVQAHDGAPGATGLYGLLDLTPEGGSVRVDARQVGLGFPDLFNTFWHFDRLQTQVNWVLEEGHTRVYAEDIQVRLDERTTLDGDFDLHLERDGDDRLALRVGLQGGHAALLKDFVPAYAVDPGLYAWLTRAIEAAEIPEGEYAGEGCISHSGPSCEFASRLWYRFDEARVRYHPDWPVVDGVHGRIDLAQGQARVQLDAGTTGELTLARTEVRIADQQVRVRTATQVPAQVLPYWLRETPLSAWSGDWLDDWRVGGSYSLGLNLTLPLHGDAPVQVEADVQPRAGRLTLMPADLTWDGIQGRVRFDSRKGLQASNLTARFEGHPVDIEVVPATADQPARIIQRGVLGSEDIAARLGRDSLPRVVGALSYVATLTTEPHLHVALEADLKDLDVNWPAPLYRPAGDGTMQVDMSRTEPGRWVVRGHLENALAWHLLWIEGAFMRGRLQLGSVSAELPGEAGLVISGRTPVFNLPDWQSLLADWSEQAPVSTDWPDWLGLVDVQADLLRAGDQAFTDMRVQLTPLADRGWQLNVDSERLRGGLRWPGPATEEPVRLHLRLADLQFTPPEPGSERITDSWHDRLTRMPQTEITVEDLRLNDKAYGHWTLRMRGEGDLLHLDGVRGQTGSLQFNGRLGWRSDGSNSSQTQLDGTLEGQDLADLSGWLHREMPITSESARVNLQTTWNGAPWDFAWEQVDGQVDFRVDKGVILEKNATAQVFRIFGVLNADTLWRRLKLDFSDLYRAGVAYDAMAGKARIREGLLTLDPDLQLVGPSGAFRISGSTHLLDERLDMRMVVVLPLTQNLPLAALLLGAAPPVGGALFLLDKVLGDPLSRLTSATYTLSGNWTEPQVNLRNVFDTRGGELATPDLEAP